MSSLFFGGLVGISLAAAPIQGQQVTERLDANGVRRDPQDVQRDLQSRFLLFGEGDRATTGMRATGQMPYIMTNTGIVDAADLNLNSQVPMLGCAACAPSVNQWFDVSPIYAAPQSEWLRFVEDVPSLALATGGGWAVSRNGPTDGFREILASDNQFGVLYSGVASTNDGSCRDHSAFIDGNLATGLTLLAGSNCPDTWPEGAGGRAFLGANPVSGEAFLEMRTRLGDSFSFDWWRVDQELIDQSKFFGNFQTYGAYDDFNSDQIGRFGQVVPGGVGEPQDEGWPLGIRTEFNAYTFALPTVANSMIWRAILINETEEVYGVPLDYERLYVGYTVQPLRSQFSTFYNEVWRGAILTSEANTASDFCPGAVPPGNAGTRCTAGDFGFTAGATGMVVLKSPIGDLRNVLLSCDPSENADRSENRAIPCPTSDFNVADHPLAGDTITYNHFVACPFGPCSGQTYLSGSDRQDFGAIASNTEDLLNGRDVGVLTQAQQYSIFRNPNFPQQVTPFSHWVPGTWDYSANGNTDGGDTIYVPSCYGPPGVTIQGTTREDRADACVVTWSDTMPVGEGDNVTYNNGNGNSSFMSIGPFPLAAGDTTALVIAMVAGPDSASFESEVNNIIDLYMSFYLSPEAPPKVTIVGADVQVEDPQLGAGRGEVTLYWDDANDNFVDPFLSDFAERLATAAGGDLARIRALNPDLEDRIRSRAADNLERILIYKSCDAGATFTDNDVGVNGLLDCDGDPATDVDGTGLGSGWQAYAVLPTDDRGEAANSFNDQLVTPGFSYLYSIVGETRGATFAIVDSTDVDGDGAFDMVSPDSLVLSPPLANPLATSTTEPNVASVYVPASTQAGAQPDAAVFSEESDFGLTEVSEVRFTGSDVLEATYRVVAGNQFEVVDVAAGEDRVETRVVARDVVFATSDETTAADVVIDSVALETENPNGVNIAGVPTSVTEMNVPPDTTVTTTVLDGMGVLVYRDDTGEPLIVSTVLDGEGTTPAGFLTRQAIGEQTGFTGFVVNVDNSNAGQFGQQTWELTLGGPAISANVSPTVVWDNQSSLSNQSDGVSGWGRYDITWVDFAFGPLSPFELNRADPQATNDSFNESIEQRQVGTVGRTDEEAAAAIAAATGGEVTTDDLVAVRVPFTVENASLDRAVDVAMLERPSARNRILLGNSNTGDTLSVDVPADAWVPDDRLYFIEEVTVDSTLVIDDRDAVVLDDSGRPIRVQRIAATFTPALLNCGRNPRPSCNPVIGLGVTGGGGGDWVSPFEGENLAVEYVPPIRLGDQAAFAATGRVVGADAIAAGNDIRAQLDSVKAVPNPYVMFSQFQLASTQQDDARLMFTHLPPEGELRIFTVSGQFVQQLNWGPEDLSGNGDLYWNVRTREGTDVAGGLYMYVVTATDPSTNATVKKIGKLVIIR
jgi:hypothetical protein